MACGCNKKRNVPAAPPTARAITSPRQAVSVLTYDVHGPDGALVASTSSSVHARAEARRVGGNIIPRRTKQ